jgi:hypothetical protein
LTIARNVGDRRDAGLVLSVLGDDYRRLDDYQCARGYYVQRRIIAQDTGDRLGEAHSLWGLPICLDAIKDRLRAIVYAQAVDIFTAIELPHAQEVRDLLAKWQQAEQ